MSPHTSNATFKYLAPLIGCVLVFGFVLWLIGRGDSSPSEDSTRMPVSHDDRENGEAGQAANDSTGHESNGLSSTPVVPVVLGDEVPPPRDENDNRPGSDSDQPSVTEIPETAREIRRTMATARPDFNECYTMLLELDPTLSGDMLLLLTVSHDYGRPEYGRIEQVSLSNDDVQINDVECFAEVAAVLDLPSPGPGQTYTLDQRWWAQSNEPE